MNRPLCFPAFLVYVNSPKTQSICFGVFPVDILKPLVASFFSFLKGEIAIQIKPGIEIHSAAEGLKAMI